MPTGIYSANLSGGGVSINSQQTIPCDHAEGYDPTLPVGKEGSLSTRSSNSHGVAAMDTGHALATNDKVDVYWATGVRYGMTCTVASDNVTLDGGDGDVLPTVSTDLVVTKRVTVNVRFAAAGMILIGVMLKIPNPNSTAVGHITFYDNSNTEIESFDLEANSLVTDSSFGATTDVHYALASNGSSTEEGILQIVLLTDSTP